MTDTQSKSLEASNQNANRSDIDSWATRLGATAIVYGITEISEIPDSQKAPYYSAVFCLAILTFSPLFTLTLRSFSRNSWLTQLMCLLLWIATLVFLLPQITLSAVTYLMQNSILLTIILLVGGSIILAISFLLDRRRNKGTSEAKEESNVNT